MFKYCTILARISCQILLYSAIKAKTPQFLQLCHIEPSADTVTVNFNVRIILLILTPYICRYYRKMFPSPGLFFEAMSFGEKFLTARMGLLLLTKVIFGVMFGQFQVWQFFKSLILEAILIAVCLGVDVFGFYSSEAAQIIFVDPLLMAITINQTLGSFCYQYPLFHIDLYLLTLCISAAEGFAYHLNKVNTVYTKQDAYRLMMTTLLFSVVYSLTSVSHFHYKYALSWAGGLPLMMVAMSRFKKSKFKEALLWMLGVFCVLLLSRVGIQTFQKAASQEM